MEKYDFWILIGLCFNFFGALMIALFSEHGTSKLWKYRWLRILSYFIFIIGFGIQISVILSKYISI